MKLKKLIEFAFAKGADKVILASNENIKICKNDSEFPQDQSLSYDSIITLVRGLEEDYGLTNLLSKLDDRSSFNKSFSHNESHVEIQVSFSNDSVKAILSLSKVPIPEKKDDSNENEAHEESSELPPEKESEHYDKSDSSENKSESSSDDSEKKEQEQERENEANHSEEEDGDDDETTDYTVESPDWECEYQNSGIKLEDLSIENLLKYSVSQGSSDLHISSGEPVRMRVDGEMTRITDYRVTRKIADKIISEVMSEMERESFSETLESDFSFEIKRLARFRANVFMHNRGMGAVFRTIPSEIIPMDKLGMDDRFKRIASFPRGLIVVTGPTGSGKSTTLAAMIDYINKTRPEHILTIEDPIEFVHNSKKSLINQREVKRDTQSFNNALRAALREDPDIILVGELRDIETITLALEAAETGHVVYATLHTSSAAKTVDRIIGVFPAEEKPMIRSMLSESLQAVIAQTLLKKEGGGRVAAHEIMLANSAIRSLIKDDKIPQMFSAIQTGRSEGMQTLDQCLEDLVQKRVISIDTARSKAKDPDKLGNR